MRMKLGSASGQKRRTGRMVHHKQHQANKLRKLADRHDRQIMKLLKRKRALLIQATKLEEQCYEPEVTTKEMVKFGFRIEE
jgi:hypothetical protein